MLFNPFNPLFKLLLGVAGNLVTFKQFVHNLIVGLFLVRVDGFDFELYGVYFSVETFDISLERLLSSL
jgi:hypothetical protein